MSNETPEQKNDQNSNGDEEKVSRLAAEMRPEVQMTGSQRLEIIRVLNIYPKKGGVDSHEQLEDVMEALEEMGSGGPDEFWDWESFKTKGVKLNDARFKKVYGIRMRKKDWRKLVEDLRGVIEAAQEPFQVTRELTKVYKAIQKVI